MRPPAPPRPGRPRGQSFRGALLGRSPEKQPKSPAKPPGASPAASAAFCVPSAVWVESSGLRSPAFSSCFRSSYSRLISGRCGPAGPAAPITGLSWSPPEWSRSSCISASVHSGGRARSSAADALSLPLNDEVRGKLLKPAPSPLHENHHHHQHNHESDQHPGKIVEPHAAVEEPVTVHAHKRQRIAHRHPHPSPPNAGPGINLLYP